MFVSWAFVEPNEQKTSCVNKLLQQLSQVFTVRLSTNNWLETTVRNNTD